jgi:hypothetical protein
MASKQWHKALKIIKNCSSEDYSLAIPAWKLKRDAASVTMPGSPGGRRDGLSMAIGRFTAPAK